MKLRNKLMLLEDFKTQEAHTDVKVTTEVQTETKSDQTRTEVLSDVDSILNNLETLSAQITEEYSVLLKEFNATSTSILEDTTEIVNEDFMAEIMKQVKSMKAYGKLSGLYPKMKKNHLKAELNKEEKLAEFTAAAAEKSAGYADELKATFKEKIAAVSASDMPAIKKAQGKEKLRQARDQAIEKGSATVKNKLEGAKLKLTKELDDNIRDLNAKLTDLISDNKIEAGILAKQWAIQKIKVDDKIAFEKIEKSTEIKNQYAEDNPEQVEKNNKFAKDTMAKQKEESAAAEKERAEELKAIQAQFDSEKDSGTEDQKEAKTAIVNWFKAGNEYATYLSGVDFGVEESLVNEAEVADEVKAEIKKLRKAYNDASAAVSISTFKKAGSEDADAEDQFTTFGDMITKTVDDYKDQVNSLSGMDDEKDPKGKENKEKLEKAVTKFKAEIAALEPEAGATEVKPQVKAALEVKQFTAELKLAELNGEDTAEIQTKLNTAIATAKVKPLPGGGGGNTDDLTDDQKERIKAEENQINRLEREIKEEEAKDEPNQAAIAGKRKGIAKSKKDIADIKAEQNTSLRINSKDLKIVSEASLSGLQSYDSEEDGYKWLKGEAKKMGVKLSVDKDPYGDGTDELNATGSKSALQKFAKLTGHDQDLGTEEEGAVYVIKETKETIKLDESMSVAEKFAILMNK